MDDTNRMLTPAEQQEIDDERAISAAFQRLLDTYLASNHRKKTEVITRAFNFAKQAHKGVRRRSGEPYILHPIAVAQIVCGEIGLGSTSICAALLHDVEEDTDYTNEDLSNLFGPKVAKIVGGVTKISGGIFGDRASLQAESFKKLLLTMSDDIRVILIKIADRLHNMRTLSSMLPSKQYKIAGETLYIYAPIAERLGLNKIKTELEVLSFKYEHPEEYQEIEDKLAACQVGFDKIFDEFTPPIRAALDKLGLEYTIKARIKSPYSIWKKMQKKHVTFEEIYDLLAIRIVFRPKKREEEINECFNIYIALSQIYKTHPDRLRDWLNQPKANGYQALHVTLMSHQGAWIEVQIRSDRMDDIAEQGFAAHWKYKNDGAPNDDRELNHWINSIREILDDPQPDTLDFLDTFKLNLFASEILVFTPKGEIKTLPTGATVLDFAFTIHSFIGSHCMGAKVNHKLVPLNHVLSSGDQVEVITSNAQRVQRDWLGYVTTAKAKGKIQAFLRREDRELRRKGEDVLKVFLEQNDFPMTTEAIEKLCRLHHFGSREALFGALGGGSLVLSDTDTDYLNGKRRSKGWRKYIPFLKPAAISATLAPAANSAEFIKTIDKKKTLLLNESNIAHAAMADCCHPIPGDDAVGYIDDAQLTIHKRNCNVALRLKSNFGNRLVAIDWDTHRQVLFPTNIYIEGIDDKGVLKNISQVLYDHLDIVVKKISLETDEGIFKGHILVHIHDTKEVKDLCNALKAVPNVNNATRIE